MKIYVKFQLNICSGYRDMELLQQTLPRALLPRRRQISSLDETIWASLWKMGLNAWALSVGLDKSVESIQANHEGQHFPPKLDFS
jgi:hypothetical protein